jgi:lipopolysaccharide export system protein LptA
MAIQIINVGNAINDGSGDDLRTAFIKVNDNFDELNDKQAENNTASNVGSGVGVFKEKLGVDLKFKSLVAGTNITITPSSSQITIANGLTGGTGVTLVGSQITIGQPVSTTSNVQFNNITANGNVIFNGNLTVNGTTTIINSNTLDVVDKNITLAKTNTPSDISANGAGITIKGTDDKTLTYVTADDKFVFNKRVDATSFHGSVIGNVTGNLTGNVTGLVNNIDITPMYNLLNIFDFGSINNQITNVIQLLLQFNTFDFGSINSPASSNLDGGTLV